MIKYSTLLVLLAVSGVYGNMAIASNCSQKEEVLGAYLDTAVSSISKAKSIIPTTDCSAHCNVTSSCSQKEVISAHLDIAVDIISKVKYMNLTGNDCQKCQKASDCADIFQMGHSENGIYKIWPNSRVIESKSIAVYCDMSTDGGGWTVIQRRGDFGSPKDYFYRDWKSYKDGFGKKEEDFWLGNDNIYALTNQKLNSVRFDLKDVAQNRRYALYDTFWIDDEAHNYTLHISNYSGDAGDSMENHNNQEFATKDRGNAYHLKPSEKCAIKFKGAWWNKACHRANLNGLYLKGQNASAGEGVTWYHWKGDYESLEWTEIKIRPIHFKAAFTSEF